MKMAKKALVLLLKAFRKENWAEEFLDGSLYCETLSFHRKKDDQEGAAVILPSASRRLTLRVGEYEHDVAFRRVTHRTNMADYINVYCMFAWAVPFEDDSKDRVILNKETQLGSLRTLEGVYGEYTVVVSDVPEFFRRLDSSVARSESEIVRMWRDLIKYNLYDMFPTTLDEAMELAFHKSPKYSGENEYRFVFVSNRQETGCFRVNIGSIRDIAKKIPTRDVYDSIAVNGSKEF